MAELVIGIGRPKKRDLRDWGSEADPPAKETGDEPAPDGEKRLLELAEKTGVEDPAALLKLVKEVAKSCMGEKPEETVSEETDE